MKRIAIGEVVQWTSQSAGIKTAKRGAVLAFVADGALSEGEGAFPRTYTPSHPAIPAGTPAGRCQWRFDGFSARPRYLVEVPREGKAPLYYAPLASVVEEQNPDAERTP
jgi:hypothetical protein